MALVLIAKETDVLGGAEKLPSSQNSGASMAGGPALSQAETLSTLGDITERGTPFHATHTICNLQATQTFYTVPPGTRAHVTAVSLLRYPSNVNLEVNLRTAADQKIFNLRGFADTTTTVQPDLYVDSGAYAEMFWEGGSGSCGQVVVSGIEFAPDGDLDGIVDASDTCDSQAETLDGFKDSDGCPDPDNDNDGFTDTADQCPGTDYTAGPDGNADSGDEPLDPLPTLTKEDYDGVVDSDGCHDSPGDDWDGDGLTDEDEVYVVGTHPQNPDTDGDTYVDGAEGCPLLATAWNTPISDDDCDGFTGSDETAITTNPSVACGFTPGAPPESETWPADLVETNGINISDVLTLKPVLGTSVPPTSPRYDIVPGSGINIADVLQMKPFFGRGCTP